MSIHRHRRLLSIALVAVAVCACRRGPANESREYPAAAKTVDAGLVGPLSDDTRAEIVSWVDGGVVTDWPAEIAKREGPRGRSRDADRSAPRSTVRSGRTRGLELVRDNPV